MIKINELFGHTVTSISVKGVDVVIEVGVFSDEVEDEIPHIIIVKNVTEFLINPGAWSGAEFVCPELLGVKIEEGKVNIVVSLMKNGGVFLYEIKCSGGIDVRLK